MARPVNLRVSYGADAGFLSRLQKAIEIDDRRSSEWRKAMMLLLNECIAMMVCSDETKEQLALQVLKKFEPKAKKVKQAS